MVMVIVMVGWEGMIWYGMVWKGKEKDRNGGDLVDCIY